MVHAQNAGTGKKSSIYDFKVTTIDGQKVDLAKYKGKVLLIVNVASECGYTINTRPCRPCTPSTARRSRHPRLPVQRLWLARAEQRSEDQEFVKKNYGVEFDLFSKVKILGKDALRCSSS